VADFPKPTLLPSAHPQQGMGNDAPSPASSSDDELLTEGEIT